MSSDETPIQRIATLNRELCALSFKMKGLRTQLEELDSQYLAIFKEKDKLERSIIPIKVIRLKVVKKEPTSGIDVELEKLITQMNPEQIKLLLGELQGCEEEGKEIEYKDEEEYHLIMDEDEEGE